jgi:glycosyltransferase involved in cell wall biosynthesis
MMTVTTVIPVYNRAQFIGRALESVRVQTYPSTEVIVVDDASTDETPYVIEGLAKTLGNLILIRLPENVGAAQARNIGAKAAKGDLIAFLDSDDWWYPEKLGKQIANLQRDREIVAVSCGMVSTGGNTYHRYIPPADISLHSLYRSNSLISCSTVLVAKKAFVRVKGFDVSLPSCQDWDLFIRLAEIGKLSVVQEELIHYSNASSGERISNNKFAVMLGHRIVFDKIYERLSDPVLFWIVRGGHECMLAEIFSSNIPEPRRALGHALKAFAMVPSLRKLQVLARAVKLIAQSEWQRFRGSSAS